jgi:hypothetical protein
LLGTIKTHLKIEIYQCTRSTSHLFASL